MSKPIEDDWSQVAQHFKDAKKLLLDLSTELAEGDGDWDRARMCFDLARDVDKLYRRIGSLGEVSVIREQSESSNRLPVAAELRESAEEYPSIQSEQGTQTLAEPKPRLRRSKKKDPVFYVQNNSLIKRGLKRNGKDTYEHKISMEEFAQFTDVLSDLASKQETFKPEEVVDSLDMSSYKVYLALGVLNHLHVLDIPQRGTYRFRDASRLVNQGSGVWNELHKQTEEIGNEL